MKNFGGGEGEPNEAVGNDENAESVPDDQAGAVKWRRWLVVGFGGVAGTLAGPTFPEAAQAVRDFGGGEENHKSHA